MYIYTKIHHSIAWFNKQVPSGYIILIHGNLFGTRLSMVYQTLLQKKKKKFNYHKLKVPQQPQYARLITIMDADILSSSHTVGFAIQNHD